MSLKVLIVPDKFKGTLSAFAAAEAISRGWHKARRNDALTLLPMSDGGDGFGEVIGNLTGASIRKTATVDAAHRPCLAPWWWNSETKTAIIESARVIGLAMLSKGKFHPFNLDTFGLGAVFQAAAKAGAKRCIIGIGGSATNDGGFGLAKALGWDFLDRTGKPIERWTELCRLEQIVIQSAISRLSRNLSITVAVDVQNRLVGARGATRVYGPQKGLRPEDFDLAERCLKRLCVIYAKQFGANQYKEPGSGAAGGLGFGLLAFLNSRMVPGFELFARYAQLDHLLQKADVVITGEGAIDKSTVMGKGVGQIALRCLKRKIPCIGLAGVVKNNSRLNRFFAELHALSEITKISEAQQRAGYWLERLAKNVGKEWKPQSHNGSSLKFPRARLP